MLGRWAAAPDGDAAAPWTVPDGQNWAGKRRPGEQQTTPGQRRGNVEVVCSPEAVILRATMPTPAPALQAADGGPLDLDLLVEALSAQFAVSVGGKQAVRRTRLDTFDRRLRSAGLTLEHEAGSATDRLVLYFFSPGGRSGPDVASTVVANVTNLTWPSLSGALPEGPVREAVAPVAGIRALMVVSDEKRRVRRLELRNEDEKTVARFELNEPAATSAEPAQVAVHALRGYEDQARRATRLLIGLGLQPVEDGSDRQPDDASSTAHIDRDAPATELLATELSEFFAAMRDNLPGLLDDVDTEFLHDFRVAVRRTRSTLKLGRPVLPPDMRSRWEPAFKWLGDLTTPVRDMDVYQLGLPEMSGWLVAADADDLAPFAAHLRRRRTTQRRALVRGLKSARFQRLVSDWEAALQWLAASEQEQATAGELADRSISRAYRKVARNGAAISASSPGVELHGLRKRCKELRYALEVFAPVIDKASRKAAVADLKGLQDVLGRFQDSEVQRHSLRELAEEMMAAGTPAQVVLAMGELVGHLDAEQDRARQDFDAAFARFVRPSSHRRMRQLGGRR
jgi:CHAD domain-containing protein